MPESPVPEAAAVKQPPSAARTWTLRALRFGVTIAAFVWVFSRTPIGDVIDAAQRVSLLSLLVAAALTAFNVLVVSSVRWRLLMSAYGAVAIPPVALLARLNWIGFFYNQWLPGGVGGDVVRGVASRRAFGESSGAAGGMTGGVAVVFVERVLGLTGLLVIVGAASVLHPLRTPDGADVVPGLLIWSALGVLAGVVSVTALALGARLAPYVPAKLRSVVESLPRIQRPAPFALAFLLSLVTQSIVAIIGHAVIVSLDPTVSAGSSFVCVPIAMATAFIPLTVGGAGAREEVFGTLYGAVGVASADAVATSLLVWATQMVVAAVGGALPLPAADDAPRPGEAK